VRGDLALQVAVIDHLGRDHRGRALEFHQVARGDAGAGGARGEQAVGAAQRSERRARLDICAEHIGDHIGVLLTGHKADAGRCAGVGRGRHRRGRRSLRGGVVGARLRTAGKAQRGNTRE
jgi:hypothetical protein